MPLSPKYTQQPRGYSWARKNENNQGWIRKKKKEEIWWKVKLKHFPFFFFSLSPVVQRNRFSIFRFFSSPFTLIVRPLSLPLHASFTLPSSSSLCPLTSSSLSFFIPLLAFLSPLYASQPSALPTIIRRSCSFLVKSILLCRSRYRFASLSTFLETRAEMRPVSSGTETLTTYARTGTRQEIEKFHLSKRF